jgi:hypothetical protein
MLCLLLIERRKRKREKCQGAFSPGQTYPAGRAALGFSRLLGKLKAVLKVSP